MTLSGASIMPPLVTHLVAHPSAGWAPVWAYLTGMTGMTAMAGPMLLAGLVSVVVVVALTLYTVRQAPGWDQRGIRPLLGWPITHTLQMLLALMLVPYTATAWGTSAAVSAAAFGWLGVLCVLTDLKTRKVPWDIAHPVAGVGIIGFALNYTTEGLLSFSAALAGLVGITYAVRWATRKGLGMSDIRLLWAATATCSWWIGQTWLLYGLILACLIQCVVRLFARRLDWGQMVPVHPDRAAVEGHEVAMRRELPFAPALVVALVASILYGTHTGVGACLLWNPFGTC